MKIAYLHQYYNTPQMVGGTRSYEMSRRWAARGHDVHVVTSSRSPSEPIDTEASRGNWASTTVEGVTVHWRQVPYSNRMGRWRRIAAFASFALKAGAEARRVEADVIFATSTPLTIILPALVAKAGRTTPLVFEVRDLWPEMPIAVGALRNPFAKALARLLELVAYRSSSAVVALSEGMADGVAKRGIPRERIVIAPNSCDFDRFAVSNEAGLGYRGRCDWLGSRELVVYCGTLGQINGLEYFVRLAAEFRERGRYTAFAIYGSGREEKAIADFARQIGVLDSNLFMLGEVPKEQVPEILSAATVCTSIFAPIPEMQANSANKFFDALAASRPIAINYEGWQADLIRSAGVGLVLPSDDVTSAATTLASFLDQPDDVRRAIGEAAARLGRELFDRDVVADRVLRTIMSAGRQR